MNADINEFVESRAMALVRVNGMDHKTFQNDYLKQNKPVVITGLMEDWPALEKWSFDFFQQRAPDLSVYVEEGNVMQDATHFREVRFGDFVNSLVQTNGQSPADRVAYLSIFNIFDAFPDLASDVDFSLLTNLKLRSRIKGWIGPQGTVTGYHIDWADNIFAQIQGRKLIKLIAPADSPCMYPSSKFDPGALLSQVNADAHDFSRFPLYLKARPRYVILEPGEMLFIPRGWWHYVRSLDPSISVNSFGWDLKGLLFDQGSMAVKMLLHHLKLYNVDNCTCHITKNGTRLAR